MKDITSEFPSTRQECTLTEIYPGCRRFQKGAITHDFSDRENAERYARSHGWKGDQVFLKGPNPDPVQQAGVFRGPPTYSPMTCTLLGLPANATREEFELAWKANGNKSSPLDTASVLEAMLLLLVKSQNIRPSQAETIARQRYPRLFKTELAKANGANERLAGNVRLDLGPCVPC